jgi:hypothetical protein
MSMGTHRHPNRQGKQRRRQELLVVEELRLEDVACLPVGCLDQPGDSEKKA